jgi:hypothetical protein
MASMPTYQVSKGPFGYLDKLFADPESDAFARALEALTGADAAATLEKAAEARHAADPDDLSEADVQHFGNEWLEAWWEKHAPAETLRSGLREAIKHAASVHKPMEFLWICMGDDIFQVYFSESQAQVTVMILTPQPTERRKVSLVEPEKIWVVKLHDDYDDEYPALGQRDDLISPPKALATVTAMRAGTGPAPQIVMQQVHHS